MAVFSEFYRHINFGAPVETFTLANGFRYRWIVFGSLLGNEISSLRANAFDGDGHVFGFTERNFLGDYAALNMRNGSQSWWSFVGDALNDDIESAIVVNRDMSRESAYSLGPLISGQFRTQFEMRLQGTQVALRGMPRIFTLFWPGHDPGGIFASIEQDLVVHVPWWFDYAAQVRYDINVYLTPRGNLDAYVAWVYTWVEGGILAGSIFDRLRPQLVAGAAPITEALRANLAGLGNTVFADAYLLPGRGPSSRFGDIGNAKEGSTLVLVRP